MEAQIRSIEHELKHLEGEELQSRLRPTIVYSLNLMQETVMPAKVRLQVCIKGTWVYGRRFNKQTDTLSGGQKTCFSQNTAYKSGYPPA